MYGKILKKYKLHIAIIWILITINMYLLTFPPKIIGNIVDLLYHIDVNKNLIMKQTIYLIITSVGLLVIRIPWRYGVGMVTRSFERDIKNKLFDHFMKIKMVNLQSTKNGELMSYFTKDIGEIRVFLYRAISLRFKNYYNICNCNVSDDIKRKHYVDISYNVSYCNYYYCCDKNQKICRKKFSKITKILHGISRICARKYR